MKSTVTVLPMITVRTIAVVGMLAVMAAVAGIGFVAGSDYGWVAVVFGAPVVWLIVSRKRRRLISSVTSEACAEWLLGPAREGEADPGQSLRDRLSNIFLCGFDSGVLDGDPLSSAEQEVFEELTRSYYR